jgi:aspartyl-tRNA(Asn)/glutamyl-tRNA(Gln) amidotransferase subunit A
MLRFHQRFDLLVAPVTRFAAIPVGGGDGIGFEMTNVFNMTHQPACAVPCGLLADGLPVALQIVGRKYGDADVLAAAHAFEAVRPFVQVPAAALAAAASGQSS